MFVAFMTLYEPIVIIIETLPIHTFQDMIKVLQAVITYYDFKKSGNLGSKVIC